MKKTLSFSSKCRMLLASVAVTCMVSSCSINPGLDEVNAPQTSDKALKSVSFIMLDKVDLNLSVGSNVTGSAIVEIRDSLGTTVLGSATVPASSLIAGTSWKTFNFSPAIALGTESKYRIYFKRSDQHNYTTNNYIFWNTSSGGNDAYPGGINDVYPSWNLDYAFTTYKSGVADQKQITATYGFATGTTYHWQEFVANRINLVKVDLNLFVGTATTGTFTTEIRNADGTQILASNVTAASLLVKGSAWNSFTFPNIPLRRNIKYRIYITRSDAHNYTTNNYIFWNTSSGGVDAYPGGINDVYPSWTLDYSFRTYSTGGLDQQQTLTTYGFGLSNTYYRWQEFVPVNP